MPRYKATSYLLVITTWQRRGTTPLIERLHRRVQWEPTSPPVTWHPATNPTLPNLDISHSPPRSPDSPATPGPNISNLNSFPFDSIRFLRKTEPIKSLPANSIPPIINSWLLRPPERHLNQTNPIRINSVNIYPPLPFFSLSLSLFLSSSSLPPPPLRYLFRIDPSKTRLVRIPSRRMPLNQIKIALRVQ